MKSPPSSEVRRPLLHLLLEAMGMRDGDYLEIRNQWGTVRITHQSHYGGLIYAVDGDTDRAGYTDHEKAIRHVLRELGSMERGRGDVPQDTDSRRAHTSTSSEVR